MIRRRKKMKVKREKRKRAKIVRITTSGPQKTQDSDGKYYYVYLTFFVIEKWDGDVIIARSEVDRHLMEAQGKKQEAFRRYEDDHFLKTVLDTGVSTEGKSWR